MEESSNMREIMTNATSAAAVSGVDLISDLEDDLLLRILSFLPAASEVARTSVLSRRWRHLWPNAIALCFTLGSKPETYTEADGDEVRRLIAAASAVVEQRATSGPDVEDVILDFIYVCDEDQFDRGLHYHAKDITSEHIAAWLLFAERRVAGRFMLAVPHHVDEGKDDDDDGAAADEQEAEVEIQEEEEEHVAEPAEGVAAAVEVESLAALVMEDEQEPVVEHDDEDNGEEKGEKVAEEIQEEEEHVAEVEEVEVDAEEEAAAVEEELEHADDDNKDEKDTAVLVAKLPCSARLQNLSLTLGKARLTVPVASTGAFDALADIFLSYARLDSAAGDDVRLSGLLSSSCSPRLRRLRLYRVLGIATLKLSAADTLEELRLTSLYDLTSLDDVAAPGLRELGVWACHELSEARISAPRVQELQFVRHTKLLQFDGAASVRCIEALPMWSHRMMTCSQDDDDDDDDYNNNSAAVWLLKNCTGVNSLCLEVMMPIWWSHMMEAHRDDIKEGDIVDMMAEVPHLPNIIDLTIEVDAYGHAIGASLAKLIAKCTNLEHLSVCMYSSRGEECLDLSCICHHQSTDWDSQKLSLEHLRSIEIRDIELLDSQIRLVRLLLASATALERMTVELDTSHLEDGEEVDFDIVPCYGGCWLPSVWECSELGLFVRPVEYEWMQLCKTWKLECREA